MRVLVCGGRDFRPGPGDYSMLADSLAPGDTVIHGCAQGADRFAAEFAAGLGCHVVGYRADWQTHGRAAGAIRNQQMLDDGKPDVVVAFPGGRGTADMVRRAQKAGVRVVLISPRPEGKGAL